MSGAPGDASGRTPSLRTSLAGGTSWLLGTQTAGQAVQLATAVGLARLVAPAEFGVFAMAFAVAGLLAMLSDLGLGAALVQAPQLAPGTVRAAQRATLGAGLAGAAGFSLAGGALASLFAEPALVGVVPWLALHVVFAASASVPQAMLARALRFRAVALVEIAATALSCGGAILLAWRGLGVHALVAQAVGAPLVASVGLHLASGLRPRLRAPGDELHGLLRFGRYLTGHRLLEHVVRHADDVLVGRFAGAAALGLYQRAYHLMLLPVSRVGDVAARVLFPALVRLRDDPRRAKALYLKAVRLVALASFPAMAGLFVVAEELLHVLFGARWAPAAPVLRVLCLVGLMQSVGTTAGVIWRAHGRSDEQFRFALVAAASALLAYGIGIQWGMLGVAWAYLLRNLSLTWFNFALPGRLIGLRYRDVIGACVGTLACAGAMALGVAALDATWLAGPPALSHLAAKIAAGALLYAAISAALRLRALEDLAELVGELRARRSPEPAATAGTARA